MDIRALGATREDHLLVLPGLLSPSLPSPPCVFSGVASQVAQARYLRDLHIIYKGLCGETNRVENCAGSIACVQPATQKNRKGIPIFLREWGGCTQATVPPFVQFQNLLCYSFHMFGIRFFDTAGRTVALPRLWPHHMANGNIPFCCF